MVGSFSCRCFLGITCITLPSFYNETEVSLDLCFEIESSQDTADLLSLR